MGGFCAYDRAHNNSGAVGAARNDAWQQPGLNSVAWCLGMDGHGCFWVVRCGWFAGTGSGEEFVAYLVAGFGLYGYVLLVDLPAYVAVGDAVDLGRAFSG